MAYKTKVLITENVIQYYVYEKPIIDNYKAKRINYAKDKEGDKQEASLNRARDNLIMTIEANNTTYTKFLTLTCKDNIFDRKIFLQMFQVFRLQFKKQFGYSLKYLAILEKQFKRQKKFNLPDAPWHIHLIVFNHKKLDFSRLKKIWGKYGSLDIKKLDDRKNISLYFAKYLTKDNIKKNKKAILKSYNLKSPNVYKSLESIIPNEYTYHSTYLLYRKDKNDATIEDVNQCNFFEIRLNRKEKEACSNIQQLTTSNKNLKKISKITDTKQFHDH